MLRFTLITHFAFAGFTLLTVVPRARADYPVASHRHLADPAAMVHAGRVYLYCSNDDDSPIDGGYDMKSLVCVSSADLKNWTDHGEVIRVPRDASWAVHTWAPAVIERDGTFFLYFANNASGIGVATSPSPTGPFTDPLGHVLINSATPGVLPAANIWIFDPAVFIDHDGQAYLYFGGNGENNLRVIRLNRDMISVDGAAMPYTVPNFFEAAWMHERAGKYYLSYSTIPSAGLRIDYLVGDSALGPFTSGGIVAGQPPSNNNNNHASEFELRGAWYHAYHNRFAAMETGIPPVYRRNIAVEALRYADDGSIQPVEYTRDGLVQVGYLNPYERVEAETYHAQAGILTESCTAGGLDVTGLEAGDWWSLRGVDFGSVGAGRFTARAASAGPGGTLEVRLDAETGPLVATVTIGPTGGAQTWVDATAAVTGATGVHDLYFVVKGTGSARFNLDWWQFAPAGAPVVTTAPHSLTLAPGQRASLWVQTETGAAVTYQWLHDGAPMTGATGAFLAISQVTVADAGAYQVRLTNAAGTTTSAAATLTVADGVSAELVNLSVRAPLTAGATLVPGFVLAPIEANQP